MKAKFLRIERKKTTTVRYYKYHFFQCLTCPTEIKYRSDYLKKATYKCTACMGARSHISPGKIFGQRVVVREAERKQNEVAWLVRCKCGREDIVRTWKLYKSKECKSCVAVKRGLAGGAVMKRRAQEKTESQCTSCKVTKPISEFPVQKSRGGLQNGKCKPCQLLHYWKYNYGPQWQETKTWFDLEKEIRNEKARIKNSDDT